MIHFSPSTSISLVETYFICQLIRQNGFKHTYEIFSKLQFVTLKKYIKGMHYYM